MNKLLLIAAMVVLIASCKKSDNNLIKVEYTVSCVECNIKYLDTAMVEIARDTAKTYWNHIFYTCDKREVYVNALNLSYTGTVSVKIWINDKIADQDADKGLYGIANAKYNTGNL